MSDTPYTVVNLKEVEDLAPTVGLSPSLEARFARKPLELEQSGLTYFRMAPGFREPFAHRHGSQEEIYVVVSGSMRMKLEDEIVELRAWDAIRIPPETMRCREAGPNGAEMILIGAPQVEDDGELLRDWWTD
ncbi:MAG: cupin domain-containing protein [Solirubrobacteraceae bacterium]